MYAIVEMAGQQFKVAKDQKVFVHRLDAKEGSKVSFDRVLLIDDNGTVTIGAPVVEGAAVEVKVLQHLKGDKVIVFKKKRRKGYQKQNGHRQYLTEVSIENIVSSGAKKATVKKATAKKAAPKKEEAKKVEAPAKEASVDYSSMTVAELKGVAKDKGISGISSMKKAELIEAILKA
jgi:large subunit ribosomal protein L21